MALTLTNAQRSLLAVQNAHGISSCWKMTRTDANVFYFTDHSATLSVLGNAYTPAGGFNASARQREAGLKSRNFTVHGVIDSSAITEDDLRAGRWRDAEVLEYLVPWRYPWLGPYATFKYWVTETKHSPEGWMGEIEGFTRWLRPPVGDVATRNCRYDLGDAKCTVDLGPLADTDAVSAIETARKVFDTTLLEPDDYWQFGEVTFTSGANNGLTFTIQRSTLADGRIHLVLRTPFDIAVSDTFSAVPGCNKTTQHCKDKEDRTGAKIFDNIVNFGGQHLMPANERLLRVPRSAS